MRRNISLDRLAEQARLYVAGDAIVHKAPHPTLKPEYDALYRFALANALARWLTVAVGKYRLAHIEKHRDDFRLLDAPEQRISKVRWWPGNQGTKPPPDVFLIRTDGFDNDWDTIRAAMGRPGGAPIWHDDPALFVRHPEGYMCRSACIGHEGEIYFFAYDHEDEWTAQLEQAGLKLRGTGLTAYLRIIQTLGSVAE
ncbi:MAG: hypothetical protein QM778_17525 [Myxococcales bacterium]